VADNLHSETLTQRVLREHRRVVVPLAVALGVNVVVYVAAVYPLSQRVANIQQRDRTAEEQLLAGRRDHAQATGTLTGKDRAAAELATFYKDVLPRDLAGARRLTQLRLAQLARESNLKFVRATFEPVNESKRTLTQLRIEMELAGTYSDVRAFIHELETAPEFLVLENVELTQSEVENRGINVNVDIATYYRTGANGN
jgi:Tfp pilus assembly protein PilO